MITIRVLLAVVTVLCIINIYSMTKRPVLRLRDVRRELINISINVLLTIQIIKKNFIYKFDLVTQVMIFMAMGLLIYTTLNSFIKLLATQLFVQRNIRRWKE